MTTDRNKNLDKAVNGLSKIINKVAKNSSDVPNNDNGNKIINGHYKGKKIIPLQEWKRLTYVDGSPNKEKLRLDVGFQTNMMVFYLPVEWAKKEEEWGWDYLELHDYILRTLAKYQRNKKTWHIHEHSYLQQTRDANAHVVKALH